MRELLTASYLPSTDSAATYTRSSRRCERARVHACTRVPTPPLSAFRIKWFRTRRLAAVYRTSRTVRHTPLKIPRVCTRAAAFACFRAGWYGGGKHGNSCTRVVRVIAAVRYMGPSANGVRSNEDRDEGFWDARVAG